MDVEIWSDVVCPWCYIGKKHFEAALESFEHRDEVAVIYRSFELDPTAPTQVRTPTVERLATKYGMSVEEAIAAQRQMTDRAATVGLDFHLEGLESGNTRDAHRLLHLARARELQPELAERLHRAYFSEQRSVFDAASLTDIAVEAGLDRDEVSQVLADDTFASDVETDEQVAQAIGVTGVPFFVIDRRFAVSGAQPAAAIVGALDQAWSEAVRSDA